ncbi:hypothetical protein CEXT_248541 [Caerostris extrusa]|uniref:Uncharacterized protein n=1 Tax=Caerostris extrusa TaxID=172846 RepID=A0AAV4SIM8_CAEEX|nr:hypothetical protein CEXT_248541 [Caerostris extrusa]
MVGLEDNNNAPVSRKVLPAIDQKRGILFPQPPLLGIKYEPFCQGPSCRQLAFWLMFRVHNPQNKELPAAENSLINYYL